MAWAENNYIETRFVGGMNCAVEPHTLDRDTGELPDIMNMVCRTQGLRTRKGFVRVTDLVAEYGTMPINAPTALFSFEYEPDLPPEETGGGGGGGEDEEDDTNGGSVVPYIDGGGGSGGDSGGGGGGHGGGGGNVKPKPEPEPEPAPEPSEAWSVLGPGSCYPYVPFDLTITRNSGSGTPAWLKGSLNPSNAGAYSGTHGRLVSQSSSSWKKQVRVNNLKRTINSVSFKAGATSSAYGECTVDYGLYGFFPDLPEAVDVGVDFEYKIECRDSGIISGYQGNGRGVSMRWTLYDANGQVINSPVTTSGSRWNNGVLKGNCTVSSVYAAKVRLTTLFLGEEHYAEAAINVGDVSLEIEEVPNALHIYGEGSRLAISAEGPFTPSYLSVACTIDGTAVNINDVLELATAEDGSRAISFASGWSEQNVWSKNVRAKALSQYAEKTLHIVFYYQNEEDRFTTTTDIDIESTIMASLSAAPTGIRSGETVSFAASISGNVDVGLDINRVPFSAMFLSHADNDGFTVTPDTDITDGENWSEAEGSLTCDFDAVITGTTAELPATFRYCLGMSNEVLAYADIVVAVSYKKMLAEAINERVLAATGSQGNASENDSLYTLYNKAESVVQNNEYIRASVNVTERATSYPVYSYQNPLSDDFAGINPNFDFDTDIYGETERGHQTLYMALCRVKFIMRGAAGGNTDQYQDIHIYATVYVSDKSAYKTDGVINWDLMRSDAINNAGSASWGSTYTYSSGTYSRIEASIISYKTSYSSTTTCTATAQGVRKRSRLSTLPGMNATVWYFVLASTLDGEPFDKHGTDVPDNDGQWRRRSYSQPATGELKYTDWMIGDSISLNWPNVTQGETHDKACRIDMDGKMILEFNFKHK